MSLLGNPKVIPRPAPSPSRAKILNKTANAAKHI